MLGKDVIDQCMSLFECPPAIVVVNKRKVKFWLTILNLVIVYACCSLVLHKRNLMRC